MLICSIFVTYTLSSSLCTCCKMLVPTRGKTKLSFNNSGLDESVATFEIAHSLLNGSFFLLSALMRSSLKISAVVIGIKAIILPLYFERIFIRNSIVDNIIFRYLRLSYQQLTYLQRYYIKIYATLIGTKGKFKVCNFSYLYLIIRIYPLDVVWMKVWSCG